MSSSLFDFISLLSGVQAKVHDTSPLSVAFTMIACCVVISYYHGQTRKLKHIPSMTSDLPLLSYLGTLRYLTNTTDMIDKGTKKWPGAVFKVPDLFEWIVVASPKHLEEIYKAPDTVFSTLEAIADKLQSDYTMGRNIKKNQYQTPILRNQLTDALPLLVPEVYDEIMAACNEFIPVTQEWQSVRAMDTMMKVVSRASNRSFVGLPLCRNPDFMGVNMQFVIDVIKTASILRMFPRFLKPVVNSLISKVPKRIEQASKLLVPLILARRQEQEQKGDDSTKPLDLLTWLMDEAKGEEATDRNLTLRLLVINFATIHTTSMTFVHAFYYLAAFQEYMQPLREEVEEVIKWAGWTEAGLDQMHKIDSFIKESQRLNSIQDLQSMRVAMNDFTFSDGTMIPRGTSIAVSANDVHFNDKVYEYPLRFDGFRFSKMRESSAKQVGMVSSSQDQLSFGIGRHICPGRHFAACVLKLMFAHIITTYDVKLEIEGVRPPNSWAINACVPNQNERVFFRKRANH